MNIIDSILPLEYPFVINGDDDGSIPYTWIFLLYCFFTIDISLKAVSGKQFIPDTYFLLSVLYVSSSFLKFDPTSAVGDFIVYKKIFISCTCSSSRRSSTQ